MVCIASDFSHHDRVAVHDLHRRIDLVRYRVFDSGLLSLLLVESAPGTTRSVASPREPRKREVSDEARFAKSVRSTLDSAPTSLRALYLKVHPDTVPLEEGFCHDMRGIGHLGTGDLEVKITSAACLDRAQPLIRSAFEAA